MEGPWLKFYEPGVPHKIQYPEIPLYRVLDNAVRDFPEKEVCSGYNVYPREIEEVLYQHPKIQEACILGLPDPYRGETVKAFVVLKDKEQATAEDIIEFCQKNMAKYKVPTQVEFRKELPKSHVGKVLKKTLREEEQKKAKVEGKF